MGQHLRQQLHVDVHLLQRVQAFRDLMDTGLVLTAAQQSKVNANIIIGKSSKGYEYLKRSGNSSHHSFLFVLEDRSREQM